MPADAQFVPPRGKQGGPKLVVEPAAGEIKKRVHFSPTISTVHRIYQSKQEVRDNRATYERVSTLIYFSQCQRIVPADAPCVPPRGKQGGPKLVEEPAVGEILLILPREVQVDELIHDQCGVQEDKPSAGSLVQGLKEFIDDKGRKRKRSTRKRSKV